MLYTYLVSNLASCCYDIHGGDGRSCLMVVCITRSRTPVIYQVSIIVQVEYMHVACCRAAAAVVDLSSSAYPLAVLSLLRPRLILPYLSLIHI